MLVGLDGEGFGRLEVSPTQVLAQTSCIGCVWLGLLWVTALPRKEQNSWPMLGLQIMASECWIFF